MGILDRPPEALTEADFQALVANGVGERKTIEYKSELPGTSDDAKKEFLADVSSFANAGGGYLIFGIEAKDGIPTRLNGLNIASPDNEILRLDSIVRDGLQPRIAFTDPTHPIVLSSGGILIVMRIPHSWNAPHMVTYRNWSRFYTRTSNGKSQLDVGEIRSAFLRSETFANRVREFRADRLARIIAGETPLSLQGAPKLILHIVPFGAFDPSMRFDLAAPEQRTSVFASVHPIGAATTDSRYNFDGLLKYGHDSYVQIFRNGCIESVNAEILYQHDGSRVIPSIAYEHRLIVALRSYLDFQRQLGIELPLLVMLSLVEVFGLTMAVSNYDLSILTRDHPIDRDTLIVPEELVQQYDCDAAQVLRPCFDIIWNAAGWPCSQNYDDQGRWKSLYR